MALRARTAEQIVAGANPADEQFRLLVESVADYAKILLVDDDARDLLAMRALLEDLGAVIHCARSGEDAPRPMSVHNDSGPI